MLYVPFRPKGLRYVFTCVAFALFLFVLTFLVVISHVYIYGGCAFASKVGRLKDPELRKVSIPCR